MNEPIQLVNNAEKYHKSMSKNKIIPFKPLPPKAPIGVPLIDAGGEIDQSSVCLRFFGDTLDPDEISELLKCQPTHAYRKGDILPDEHYHIVAKHGSWHLECEIRSDPLEKQILELFDRLSSDLEIWRKLTRQSLYRTKNETEL